MALLGSAGLIHAFVVVCKAFEAGWSRKLSAAMARLCPMSSHSWASLGLVVINYLDRVLRESGEVWAQNQTSHFLCVALPKQVTRPT